MNLMVLGPQGSGKGTQAELLKEKFRFNYFDAGKILRSVAGSDNGHAAAVKQAMAKGEMVPDEYMRLIAWDYINKHDKEKGFLFDGYPRSTEQYEQLQDMLRKFGKKLDKVIYLNISEDESVKRLSGRRTCVSCGEIYNLITDDKPGDDMKCSKCGGEIVQREDDKPEAIKRRLELYHKRTKPILELARGENLLLEVNGEKPIDEIYHQITSILGLQYGT